MDEPVKVVTRTCPECGHRHSIAASTSEAAEFISLLELECDELRAALAQAAKLFEAMTQHKIVFHDKFHAWLALPIVQAARKAKSEE